MIESLYVEQAVRSHPRVEAIIKRHSRASVIECNHYGEVFNRKAQNFRLQKGKPALILARKEGKRVYEAPPDHALGGTSNYYFSHLLNCPFDCRYCFLQGKFDSANYVLFVNYEDFLADIDRIAQQAYDLSYIFSGYDCDSLALEPVTGFVQYFVPAIAAYGNLVFELRTKSTQIRQLLRLPVSNNCVVAYSLAPQPVIESYEHGTPSLAERLAAIRQLQEAGWLVGLRFDPMFRFEDHLSCYSSFFETVCTTIDMSKIHSLTLGSMRLPKSYAKKITRLYPDEALLAHISDQGTGTVGYSREQHRELMDFAVNMLAAHCDRNLIFEQGA